MQKVVIGMSGGVDSAVAAFLLKEKGYDVIGVTLRTWMSDDGEDGRCCEIDDAAAVARKLGIPYHPFNCTSLFKEKVTDPFVRSYLDATTPNPCIECNRYVKWEGLLNYAKVLGADLIATGHYAHVLRLDNGRYTVKTASHAAKDQTYMLYKLTQDQLSHTLMPLGDLSKEEVRKIASDAGIPVADKPDSQEICFVPDGDYAGYIKKNAEGLIPGEGNFVDEDGNILGLHKGIIHYTVGQRKGLGIAMGYPVFVKKINKRTNEVVLSDDASLYSDSLTCRDVNFLSIEGLRPGQKLSCRAKIRYHHKPAPAVVEALDNDRILITFDEPVRAVTPGQSTVFYDDNECVIGGGIIE